MAPHIYQPHSSQHLPQLPTFAHVTGGFVPPPRNTKTLDYHELNAALCHLASLIALEFQGQKVTLFAHGGAVMVLHRDLGARLTTRDVDVCLREFNEEWELKGVENAESMLRYCIYQTAQQRKLGADWMNNGPDAALPWAYNQGQRYDPVLHYSRPIEVLSENAIFTSSSLDVVGISWQWAVALKLYRYKENDPRDIACILHYHTMRHSISWTLSSLKAWIRRICWAMCYDRYSKEQKSIWRGNMKDALRLSREKANIPHVHRPLLSQTPLSHHLPRTSTVQPSFEHPTPPVATPFSSFPPYTRMGPRLPSESTARGAYWG